MLDLLDVQSRWQVQAQVRALVEQGDLAAATMLIEEFVSQSGDDALVHAGRIAADRNDVDWVEVCADGLKQTIASPH